MRKFPLALGLLFSLTVGTAKAQFCPGAAPYVFTDVPASDAFCGFITWMAQTGVTTGCQVIDSNNRLYCPEVFVTRKQIAAFMSRLGRDVAFAEGGNAFGTLPSNTAVLGTADGNAFDIRVNGTRVMRYEPTSSTPNVIGGSASNAVATGVEGAVIGGGGEVGFENWVFHGFGTVAGGWNNRAGDPNEQVFPDFATVGGGLRNAASGHGAVIAGGESNVTSGAHAAIGGGFLNTATNFYSTVPGGFNNLALGRGSFAAGTSARASFEGCFVFADYSNVGSGTSCFLSNAIVMRGLGGFYFWTAGTDDNSYSGARLAPGTGAWAAYSDVHGKEALEPVDAADILERLLTMPVARWQWKAESGNVKHIGPTAQDFRAAFGLGDSDKQIVTVDADGVALAAIQGLNAKLEQREAVLRAAVQAKDAEITKLRSESADLKREMAELRLAVEVLMTRTSAEGRVAQTE